MTVHPKDGKTNRRARQPVQKIRTGATSQSESVSKDPEVIAKGLRAEFFILVKKLLLEDLPSKDVRSTFSREKGFKLTSELLADAPTWKKIEEQYCEIAEYLVRLAVTSFPASESEKWIERQLELTWRALLECNESHNGPTGSWSVLDLACTILLSRWEIGIDSSRSVLSEKMSKALRSAKLCASLALLEAKAPLAEEDGGSRRKQNSSKAGKKPDPDVAKRRTIVRAHRSLLTTDLCKRFDSEAIPWSRDAGDFPGWVQGLSDRKYRRRIQTLISKDKNFVNRER